MTYGGYFCQGILSSHFDLLMTFSLSESQLHPNASAYSVAMKTTWNCMQILFLFSLMTSNLYYFVLHHRNVKNHKDSL